MAGSGVNFAITKDGGAYNKLQRPQDYLMTATALPPPKNATHGGAPSQTSTSKRKHENADNTLKHKRSRSKREEAENVDSRPGTANKSSRRTKFGIQVELPGLDGDCSSDDDIGEALAYLRSVRSEASALPTLLVASTTHDEGSSESSQRAVFRDGTWIAIDEECDTMYREESCPEDPIVPDAQDRLYQLLLKRFHCLRATLAEVLDRQRTSRMPTSSTSASETWLGTLDMEYPRPEQVVRLKSSAVYAALKKAADGIDRVATITPQSSCWIWTLLAWVGDAGTLDNDKMSRIRDVGQRAGLLGVRLRAASTRQLPSNKDRSLGRPKDIGPQGSGDMFVSLEGSAMIGDGGAAEVEQARARAYLLTQLGDRLVRPQLPVTGSFSHSDEQLSENDGSKDADEDTGNDKRYSQERGDLAGCGTDLNTQVTIDMILTVVAEYFGQRDLLKYRERW